MKNFTKLIVLISILYTQITTAQRPTNFQRSKVEITGKVIEKENKQALEYATIVLTAVKTKKITGGITDAKGNFKIEAPKGLYNISIEFLSLKTYKIANRQITENTNLGTIALEAAAESLDEVEIIAEKSTVEIRLDKKIYNVGKDMTIKGGNASDVLDNVPSVNVDAQGAVSLRGNENVRILIDGKPSALVGLSGTAALRNLPADAIEKVEVITSPSARYDAEGTAGILNIILRKGKVTGFNGSANTTIGYPAQYGVGANLNYRTKKVNVFSNIGYRYRKGPGNSFAETSYLTNNFVDSTQIENRNFDRKSNNYNASVGLEYYLNKNSSITGTFFYGKSKDNDVATNVTNKYLLQDPTQNLLNETRIENEKENGIKKQYSLNYTNNFDGKGQKLNIDLQYGDNEDNEPTFITVNNILSEKNSQTTTSNNTLVKIDYVLPIGKNSQFEIGHKSDLQDLESDFRVRDANGNPLTPDVSNAIDFKQNVYAFYSQFGSKVDKFSYLLGLRAEITDIDLKVITTGQKSDKNYTQWFPTINLGYELNDNDNITLGYARRLRRPRHWFLNPFESRSSATSIFRGNPDLNPTYTSSFDLGYNTKINKFNLGASLYYQYSTDIIQPILISENRIDTNGNPIIALIRQPTNLNNENRYGFEFTSNYNPSKKVRLTASFNYFKFKTDAFSYSYTTPSGNEVVKNLKEVNENSWFTRFNARITLPAKIQWQTRIMYRGPRITSQSDRKGMFTTSLAFSKDLFKDKATLVLNVSDLFNSRKRESTSYIGGRENPNIISNGTFQWRERQISLNFTYRFNQKKKRGRPSRREYDSEGEGYGG